MYQPLFFLVVTAPIWLLDTEIAQNHGLIDYSWCDHLNVDYSAFISYVYQRRMVITLYLLRRTWVKLNPDFPSSGLKQMF